MRRMRAAQLPIGGPTALFITHLHTDHTLGYPDVIFTTWTSGHRKTPLEVYGPHGLQAMTNYIIAAWKEDIDVRTNGLAELTPNGYAVHVHEIAPGVVYDSAGVKITAIPVLHGSWKEAYGYRVDTPDRSIVLSGDTQAVARARAGCTRCGCPHSRSVSGSRRSRRGAHPSGRPNRLSARVPHERRRARPVGRGRQTEDARAVPPRPTGGRRRENHREDSQPGISGAHSVRKRSRSLLSIPTRRSQCED